MYSKEQSTAYRSDILHDGEFELIAVFREEFLEVLPFIERSDNSSDGVAFLQEDVNDVNREEPVCTSDKDLISWSDSRHGLQSLRGSDDVEDD